MHYFEFGKRDTTLYSGGTTSSINTGLDEILEVNKVVNNNGTVGNVSRILIDFDLAYQISLVDGVVSIVPPEVNNPNRDLILIENKYKVVNGYSGNVYDIDSATQEGIIYPSLDPSIFELKFPNTDIEGRVVGDR